MRTPGRDAFWAKPEAIGASRARRQHSVRATVREWDRAIWGRRKVVSEAVRAAAVLAGRAAGSDGPADRVVAADMAGGAPHGRRTMRILLVEDDKDLQRLLKRALTDAGYVVDVASDGEEGHYLVDTEPYDAVILDLGLPKMDGVRV